MYRYYGNQAADLLAKRAATYGLPPAEEEAGFKLELAHALAYLRAAARMLASFPPSREVWGVLPRARQPAPPRCAC